MKRYISIKETIEPADDMMAYDQQTEYWDNLIKTSDDPALMKKYVDWLRMEGDLTPSSSTMLNDFMKETGISQDEYALLKHETEKTPYKNEE